MDTETNVLSDSLAERWDKYRAQLKTCKDEFSEEAVHDLRVATRRLLAVMDLLRILDPHPRVKKVRRVLKDQLDSLDELRDTQVMLVDISESMTEFPDLQRSEEHLQGREKKLMRKARKEIKSLRLSELKNRIEKSRASWEVNVPGEELTARLLSAVDQVYARAKQAFGEIEAAQPPSIHRFRVAFRKFRYTVEIVNPVLKYYPEAYLQQMHDYQSRMGDIQDATIFLNTLAEYAEQTDSATLLAPVHDSFENHRTELLAKFMEGKEEFHLFWRASPDAKFTWEKNNESVHRSSRHRSAGGNTRIRRRQSSPADRKGQKKNAEDSAGIKGNGDKTPPDSDQSVPAGSGDSPDSEEDV